MGLFGYRTFFLFGGPLHFFAFGFVIGFWREVWGTGRVTAGGLRRRSRFFLGDISLWIQYRPVLYSSVLFTIFSFGLSRSFFALIFPIGF